MLDQFEQLNSIEKRYQQRLKLIKFKTEKLFKAIKNNASLTEMSNLIEDGADKDFYDEKENATPLIYALKNDNKVAFHFLLDNGASIFKADNEGRDVLFYLMENGYKTLVKKYLKEFPLLIKTKTTRNYTRLMKAVSVGDLELVNMLLAMGVDRKEKDDLNRTALHYNFLRHPYTETDRQISLLLMDLGLDPMAKDKKNIEAYSYGYNNESVQEMLLEKGYDIDEPNAKMKREILLEKDREAYLKEENKRIIQEYPTPDIEKTARPQPPKFNGPKFNTPKF